MHWVVGTAVSRFSRRQLDFLQTSFLAPAGHGGSSEGLPISTDGNSRPRQCRGRRRIYWSGTGSKPACDTAECEPEPPLEPVRCLFNCSFYGFSTVFLVCFTCPAMTVVTGYIKGAVGSGKNLHE